MPQRSQFICSRCGVDIGASYPEAPVVTYIVSGSIGGSDVPIDADMVNPGVEAMLMLDTPRVELCPGCAAQVLQFDGDFVNSTLETANRQTMARNMERKDIAEEMVARRQRILRRHAEDESKPRRMTKTEAKEASLTSNDVEPLYVSNGSMPAHQPAAEWYRPPNQNEANQPLPLAPEDAES